jgi:NRPS condensation-like uncharacterized protein
MRRALSPIERMIWSVSSYFQSIGSITVRIRGELSVAQMHMALARLRVRHPLLAVRVREQHPWSAHFLTEGVPELEVRVVEARAEDTWRAVTEEELLRPFSFDTGPLVRFVLVRSEGFSDLVVVANHVVADGLSHIYLIRDILQELGDPALASAPPAAARPMEDLFPPPPASGSDSSLRRTPESKPARGPAASDQAGPLSVLWWSLSEDESARVCARSRAERTTVYAAICAAFIRAVAELDTSSSLRRIETPVSVRGRLSEPIGEVVGNYVLVLETAIDCVLNGSFWELARLFKQQLNQELERDAPFSRWRPVSRFGAVVPSAVLRWLLRFALIPMKINYDFSITNLGRIHIPSSYGPLQIQAIHAPCLSAAAVNHRVLAVMMFDERISFSLSTQDRALAGDLKQRAMHHLRQSLV